LASPPRRIRQGRVVASLSDKPQPALAGLGPQLDEVLAALCVPLDLKLRPDDLVWLGVMPTLLRASPVRNNLAPDHCWCDIEILGCSSVRFLSVGLCIATGWVALGFLPVLISSVAEPSLLLLAVWRHHLLSRCAQSCLESTCSAVLTKMLSRGPSVPVLTR
jgi:hypothetical protein